MGHDPALSKHFGIGGFFFEGTKKIEKWHKSNIKSLGYDQNEELAGYPDLERFGILNVLPTLCHNFNMPRGDVLKLSVVEIYKELQRLNAFAVVENEYRRIMKAKRNG